MKRIILIALAIVSLASCRKMVLEDRTACPSFLFFDITNHESFNGYDKVYSTVYSYPKGLIMDDGVATVDEIQNEEFYYTVKSTPSVKGYGLIGNETLNQEGSNWTCPVGTDYAKLFRFQYLENVQEESFFVPVEFVKDYSHVKVQFKGFETFHAPDGRFPFDVVIYGNTNGIDALTGTPLRGTYQYAPAEDGFTGLFEFNLPRLADDYLRMELYGREGISEDVGHLATFDLYEEIRSLGGVNWREKNLPDIEITIDYVQWKVTVTIDPWDNNDLGYEY